MCNPLLYSKIPFPVEKHVFKHVVKALFTLDYYIFLFKTAQYSIVYLPKKNTSSSVKKNPF